MASEEQSKSRSEARKGWLVFGGDRRRAPAGDQRTDLQLSDTWQLVINTGTTIVTFLMVFLIQHTQNRDAKAINLKMNEIIFALGRAKNDLIEAEKLSFEEELSALDAKYERIRGIVDARKHEVSPAADVTPSFGGSQS